MSRIFIKVISGFLPTILYSYLILNKIWSRLYKVAIKNLQFAVFLRIKLLNRVSQTRKFTQAER